MKDNVLDAFLRSQQDGGLSLARESDLIELFPLDGDPARRYLARFLCRGLVKTAGGAVEIAERFEVGISFSSDHLRRVEPARLLTWLAPRGAFHPNLAYGLPFLCIGPIAAGTSLVDLLYRIFEVITYKRVTMSEDDCLNREACQWARRHKDRFPIDPRPLKRRVVQIRATVVDRGAPDAAAGAGA